MLPENVHTYTVAIATLNRERLLRLCLAALGVSLAGRPVPVIVVDNGSTDGTEEVARRFEQRLNLRYLREPRTGLSYARNTAGEVCTTEYIVHLDDDAQPLPGWANAIERGIIQWNPDVFGGGYRPFYLSPKPVWFDDRYGTADAGREDGLCDATEYLHAGNCGWRLAVLRAVGGFPTDLGMAGDTISVGEETYVQTKLRREYPATRRVFLRDMTILHLVSEQKLHLRYWFVRYWATGRSASKVFAGHHGGSSVARLAYRSVLLLAHMAAIPLRSRREYPYWQRYVLSEVCPQVAALASAWPRRSRDAR